MSNLDCLLICTSAPAGLMILRSSPDEMYPTLANDLKTMNFPKKASDRDLRLGID